MIQDTAPTWQVWLIGLGDYLRTANGTVQTFVTLEEAKRIATEVGGIVQLTGAPGLGGFDRALS